MIRYEIITSRQSEKVKRACALTAKKERDAAGQFFFEGHKLLGEALKHTVSLAALFVTKQAKERYTSLLELAAAHDENTVFYEVAGEVYAKLSQEKAPEGIFCVANRIDKSEKNTTIYSYNQKNGIVGTRERLLLCECIQNPGNLGTLLRTANAFGYDRVILTEDCADVYSDKVIRAAMGATFCLPVVHTADICLTIASLQAAGYPVAAAALTNDAVCLTDYTNTAKAVFVIGNEGAGLKPTTIQACDSAILIPMGENSESLNATAAATILMWEQFRQNTNTAHSDGENR